MSYPTIREGNHMVLRGVNGTMWFLKAQVAYSSGTLMHFAVTPKFGIVHPMPISRCRYPLNASSWLSYNITNALLESSPSKSIIVSPIAPRFRADNRNSERNRRDTR